MDTVRDLLLLLIFLGAAQGLFLGVALWGHQRGNRTANRVLAALLIVVALLISNFVVCKTEMVYRYPFLANLYAPLIFACGPLFVFYVKALTTPGFRFQRMDLLHAAPLVLCTVYLLPYYFQDVTAKLNGEGVHWSALLGLLCLHLLGYLIWVIVLLVRHAAHVKHLFSSIQQVDLAWLRNLTVAVLAIWMANVLVLISGDFSGPINYVSPLLLSFVVYGIGYLGFRQPEIFSGRLSAADTPDAAPERYATSTLTARQAATSLDALRRLMAEQQPHLDPNLTLPDLAERLSMSTHHLSQLLNQHLRQNFFDFVNGHRVEEAKRRLADPRSAYLTIVAIAQEAGFNSKSAFYTAFRKHAGVTPSQFRGAAEGGALAA